MDKLHTISDLMEYHFGLPATCAKRLVLRTICRLYFNRLFLPHILDISNNHAVLQNFSTLKAECNNEKCRKNHRNKGSQLKAMKSLFFCMDT